MYGLNRVSPFDEIFNFQREVDRLFTHVNVEVAGNTLSIRAEEPRDATGDVPTTRYEQTLTLPPFLDVDKLSASHRHGMLQLTVPLRESAKRRR
jgi:HSP20 family molecular chaperone IbpA